MRVIILDNFATVGIPDSERSRGNIWSIDSISRQLLPESRLKGLHRLDTRKLDLVIRSGTDYRLLNLQTFTMFDFDSSQAVSLMRKAVAHYTSSDGNVIVGILSAGNVFVLSKSFKNVRHIRPPVFLNSEIIGIFDRISDSVGRLLRYIVGAKNRVSSEFPGRNFTVARWTSTIPPEHRATFPFITAAVDGFTVFLAVNPSDCFVFLTCYRSALRQRNVVNFKKPNIPGRWYRIIMDRNFIYKWLENKDKPFFESRVCYSSDDRSHFVVGGAMLYAVFVDLQLEVAYGVIKSGRGHKGRLQFTMAWETIKYEVDWAVGDDGLPMNYGSRYVVRLSSDCRKMAIFINTHLGAYTHVQLLPSYPENPVKLERQMVALCSHADYDGQTFYNRGCWISDVQWLADDAYFACVTHCGCLAIFHVTGEPMVLKIREPGTEPDESKSAKYYFPVFYPHQISVVDENGQRPFPHLKWNGTENVLSVCSGTKSRLFSIKRVLNESYIPPESRVPVVIDEVEEAQRSEEAASLLVTPIPDELVSVCDEESEVNANVTPDPKEAGREDNNRNASGSASILNPSRPSENNNND